jgi:anti-sigma regulatory factor (Ser/Thr protein kinase)
VHSQQRYRWPISNDLTGLRRHLYHHAGRAGLAGERRDDLVLAANEAIVNVLEHGGAIGTVIIRYDTQALTVDIVDAAGRLRAEHAPHERPGPSAVRGFGLWLMSHLCDEFTIDQADAGSPASGSGCTCTRPPPRPGKRRQFWASSLAKRGRPARLPACGDDRAQRLLKPAGTRSREGQYMHHFAGCDR